ncbi:MAG: DUF2318 domain-containing protein [Oscillospiraceae bacterium]
MKITRKPLLAAAAAFALLTACASENNASGTNAPQTVAAGQSLVIEVADVTDDAGFYPVTVDGTSMEVIAVKAPDGTIRTALNTCQVCNGAAKAYFLQVGDKLQCQNCKNTFTMDMVETTSGGCNPVPLFDKDKTVTAQTITVQYDTLKANAAYFPANWKK